jgi:hypothetical protein
MFLAHKAEYNDNNRLAIERGHVMVLTVYDS